MTQQQYADQGAAQEWAAEQGETMENLELWKKVFVTDPAAVKPITGKTYKGNSPKPYWIIQRATEIFGPIGIGWGVVVKSERFERMSDTDVLHVAVVSVWYVLDGKRSETFDQMGGTKAAYLANSGKLVVDEDAGKKSVTDGMVKCLSMIGFAGDIFSGRWDDSGYVKWASEQFKPETQDTSPEASAARLAQGIASGDAAGAALAISGWDDSRRDAVWALLSPKNQDALTKAWPKT